LPHEYRQSQEMADIAGFYHAFGFQIGGLKRERPDHLAVEFEFMYALALKEAYARANDLPDFLEVVMAAQGKFLQDHLGKWVGLFSQVLAQGLRAQSLRERARDWQQGSPYQALSLLASDFVAADSSRLGVSPGSQSLDELKPTPYDIDYSCSGCAVAETSLS
jgi:putative dimethyl sulfoxide reductase chaperone